MSEAAAPIIAAIISATGSAVAAEVGKPGTPKPPAPQPVADPESAAARQREERRRRAQAGGRASTIMSGSPLGVPGGSTSPGRGARLTGGY